jgi:amino acid adenylation domain-containing protein
LQVDATLTEQLNQLAQQHDATLFMVLLAALNALLARYSRQEEILVGAPIANRTHRESNGVCDSFDNTLVLRTRLADNPSFIALLDQVRQSTLLAYQHQDLPFERLVDALHLERTLSYHPLFQVMLVLYNTQLAPCGLPEGTMTRQGEARDCAQVDLTLYLQESPDGLQGIFEYASNLFDATTIARMTTHFATLLAAIVAQPDQPVFHLPMLTAAEYQQIVYEWNATAVDFGPPQTIHTLFEQQVTRTPDAVAVIFEDGQLTYAELNAQANQLAHYLQSLGVGPEVLVGICVERSLDMMVGLLGILKAGGAYVPLDPGYPPERLAFMLQDSKAAVLLAQTSLQSSLPTTNAKLVYLDMRVAHFGAQAVGNPISPVHADNLAYVIYTSGSTGQPKGVMVTHGALVNLTQATRNLYHIQATDRVLQFASFSFDVAAEEIYPCLTSGATLILRSSTMVDSLATFTQATQHSGITVWNLPTAYWHLLTSALEAAEISLPTSLRLVIIGGERALPEQVVRWQQVVGNKLRLLNCYGPTEATVTATAAALSPTDDMKPQTEPAPLLGEVPIGRPLANVQTYILDNYQQIVPIAVIGELYIGGAGLARGYLNQPELTRERFIEHATLGWLYKTGDLCRWLADGNLEYCGRTDFQVKIRGFRVELGEIENTLSAQEGVRQAVVLAQADAAGNKYLIAYVGGEAESHTLRQRLAERLPDYMTPSVIMVLERLPLTPNGKIDRKALSALDYRSVQSEYTAPRNAIEATLAQVIAQVLGLFQVGVHDHFFRMGGDSVLSIQVVSRMAQAGYRLRVNDLFQHPTIAELALLISTDQVPNQPQADSAREIQSSAFNENEEEF